MTKSSDERGSTAPEQSATLPTPPARVARRAATGRRSKITLEMVVTAAIEELDETGTVGLSMRRVADRLHTGVASLYSHVNSKEELLELIFDTLIGTIPLLEPDTRHWREQVHSLARSYRDVLSSHADAALAGMGRVPTSPRALEAIDCLIGVLAAGDLSNSVIALGLDQFGLYVAAFAYEDFLRGASVSDDELERYFVQLHGFIGALPSTRFPHLARIADDMIDHDRDERFEFGIDVLIEGLVALNVSSAPPAASA